MSSNIEDMRKYTIELGKGEVELLENILRNVYDYRTKYGVANLDDALIGGVLKQIVNQWKEADK